MILVHPSPRAHCTFSCSCLFPCDFVVCSSKPGGALSGFPPPLQHELSFASQQRLIPTDESVPPDSVGCPMYALFPSPCLLPFSPSLPLTPPNPCISKPRVIPQPRHRSPRSHPTPPPQQQPTHRSLSLLRALPLLPRALFKAPERRSSHPRCCKVSKSSCGQPQVPPCPPPLLPA